MMVPKFVYIFLFIHTSNTGDVRLISQTRTSYLEKYTSYSDTVLMHFDIPRDVSFVAFKFRANEISYSVFGCTEKEIVLNLKHGSPPIVNPDDSPYPEKFMTGGRSERYDLNFSSDKKYEFINISFPMPGSYYAIAYFPYSDPKNEGITQAGLIPQCHSYVDADIYVTDMENMNYIMPNVEIKAVGKSDDFDIYKFHPPNNTCVVAVFLKNFENCEHCTNVTITLRNELDYRIFNKTLQLKARELKDVTKEYSVNFWITDTSYYYMIFNVAKSSKISDDVPKFNFHIQFYDLNITELSENVANGSSTSVVQKILTEKSSVQPIFYKQFDLHKSLTSESFLFTYELQPLPNGSSPLFFDMTNEGFTALKFHVKDTLDVGGSMQAIFAFKPKILRNGRFTKKLPVPDNYTIVVCITGNEKKIPTWDQNCTFNGIKTPSPLVLNSTNQNDSAIITFPEAGDWYATLSLFCGECVPCNCPQMQVCKEMYEDCATNCLRTCLDNECDNCLKTCKVQLLQNKTCEECDCHQGCRKPIEICNTTVVFDISSYPCISYGCSSNGKCVYTMSEGFVYTSCRCSNNYKGWDCSDDSNATTMAMLILEMCLLVLSNIAFLIACRAAYKRRFYVEMLVYFSIFFFSSIYHMCDAGEHIISVCIASLNVLQYCDFFCALLSIWVTLIAMAHLPKPAPHLLHMGGAIIIGAGTTLDKTSVGVFLLPTIIGIVIVISNWGYKYYKTRVLFPSKRYWKVNIPLGLVLVVIGLTLFSFLQTQSNYKYVHSVWHIIMAIAVTILLPDMNNFIPSHVLKRN